MPCSPANRAVVLPRISWVGSWVGSWWNDRISSIIVVNGTWRFYEHKDLQGRYWDLRPGFYRWVVDAGIPNDIISSFQCIGL